eukprot:CAMPEP_0177652378 /NCGR_PEP_ID=MMETSP0447-20121125/13089_1 /TAXON_ID=0 /ORGANISM="Stygamoeba regulata, Strain BSH-02190019" /LENGTH=164 /DNA_ID=CAMNT_0019155601 /DNA_START=134 /DNA_END=631 /DNA_ORIENTATION=+
MASSISAPESPRGKSPRRRSKSPRPDVAKQAELRSYFESMDEDHNGRIDAAELTHAFEKSGFKCPAEVISKMLQYAGNGKDIDLAGFVRLSGYLDFMRTSFDRADADKNGAIDKQELGAALMDIGLTFSAAQLNALIDAADVDHSGTLSFDEYILLGFNGLLSK